MPSDVALQLCRDSRTVSATWAQDPSRAPSDIIKELYGEASRGAHRTDAVSRAPKPEATRAEAQQEASQCGKWGGSNQPSPLFLQAFADSLRCIEQDPLVGMVSPPLMGSNGTMPLTAICPLADIIRHCSNLIVRAESEVFFVTCNWAPSVAQKLISNAIVELSKRSQAKGKRVAFKLVYANAGISKLSQPRKLVKPSQFTSKAVGLPDPKDIPNVDLEVMTFHKLPLGTLHAKFCVIDRKSAVVMSNNMEDNDNMEMAIHVEGPIVESIYDTAVITWNLGLDAPPAPEALGSNDASKLESEQENSHQLTAVSPQDIAAAGEEQSHLAEHTEETQNYDKTLADEIIRMQSAYAAKPDESRLQAANRQLNIGVKEPIKPSGPDIADGEEMVPYLSTEMPNSVPMAMVSRAPYGCFGSEDAFVPQNEAWLSLIRNAKKSIFIQTPDLNAPPVIDELVSALKRGVEVTYYVCFGYNDLGEMIPGQGGTNDQVAISLVESLPEGGPERKLLHIYSYVAKDQDHPIHHRFKSRSCHIKLLIADDCVGIQGSGNQDTQSWFHSQEINVMVDSEEICRKWREGIDRNQNTKQFGRVAADGIWRDQQGEPGRGYTGNPGPVKGLVQGVVGMALKSQGLGGF